MPRDEPAQCGSLRGLDSPLQNPISEETVEIQEVNRAASGHIARHEKEEVHDFLDDNFKICSWHASAPP